LKIICEKKTEETASEMATKPGKGDGKQVKGKVSKVEITPHINTLKYSALYAPYTSHEHTSFRHESWRRSDEIRGPCCGTTSIFVFKTCLRLFALTF